MKTLHSQQVRIPVDTVHVDGVLVLPLAAKGLVVFVHGAGSSRHSPRNKHVAQCLQQRGMATLLLDLLTPEEDANVSSRFNIELLTRRLLLVTHWLTHQPLTQTLPIAYFGASTGAAAALLAATQPDSAVRAVVSRGGRPDLVSAYSLSQVRCPTLLLVGGADTEVLALNQQVCQHLTCVHQISVIAGATHLFEEPGCLDAVAQQAADWFDRHIASKPNHAAMG